jgi:hypothetical protein
MNSWRSPFTFAKRSNKVVFAILVMAILMASVWLFFQEPSATQGVNNAADLILAADWDDDLTELADVLLIEFQSPPTDAPQAFMGGFLISIDKLPKQYLQLGGSFAYSEPEFVFRPGDQQEPDRIVLDWAHMRHAVIIYAEPPQHSPTGFHVRQVSTRIYVVANES